MKGKHVSRKLLVCSFSPKEYPHTQNELICFFCCQTLNDTCVLHKATLLVDRVTAVGSVSSSPMHVLLSNQLHPGGWMTAGSVLLTLNKYLKNSERLFCPGKNNNLKTRSPKFLFKKILQPSLLLRMPTKGWHLQNRRNKSNKHWF